MTVLSCDLVMQLSCCRQMIQSKYNPTQTAYTQQKHKLLSMLLSQSRD